MSPFGIFATVFTLVIVIYYAVVIWFDLHKMGKKDTGHGETFKVDDMQDEEKPTVVPEPVVAPHEEEQQAEEEPDEGEQQDEPEPPKEPTEAEKKAASEAEQLETPEKGYLSDMSMEDYQDVILASQQQGPKFGIHPPKEVDLDEEKEKQT